jgi:hypothetical protein
MTPGIAAALRAIFAKNICMAAGMAYIWSNNSTNNREAMRMINRFCRTALRRRSLILFILLAGAALSGVGIASILSLPVPATIEEDFFLSGTQVFDIDKHIIQHSGFCALCHAEQEPDDPYKETYPHFGWESSKMAHAGRNPLFMAKMTLANQLVDNAGYFCMRCHIPHTFITGNALDPWGDTLDHFDMDGVSCHFCHTMVDPIYKPGVSPPEDKSILASLDAVPEHYGNSMFVIDPTGTQRGSRGAITSHDSIFSPFHASASHCGTCHDVGNPVVSKQPDGTYWFNPLGEPVPDEDLWTQYPLERTYTEWKLSEYAATGVDMGGRFGGSGHPTGIMHSCQDCHMPREPGFSTPWGEWHADVATHTFAGSNVWGMEMIGLYWEGDPAVNPEIVQRGIDNALSQLQRAVTLEATQEGAALNVKIINEAGHKLPTGHIEGRRVFSTVKFFDKHDQLVLEYGGYDYDQALLDASTTVVYEMQPGISEAASKVLGLPPGPSMASVVADVILKDTRIPPRGFNNEAYAAAGAPVVGYTYEDGQHWDEPCFAVPPGAVRAEVTVNYQMMTRAYIESLRDNNHTDHWGDTIYDLWLATDKAPPVQMAIENIDLQPVRTGDLNGDGMVDVSDLLILFNSWGTCPPAKPGNFCPCPADLNADGIVDVADLLILFDNWG